MNQHCEFHEKKKRNGSINLYGLLVNKSPMVPKIEFGPESDFYAPNVLVFSWNGRKDQTMQR